MLLKLNIIISVHILPNLFTHEKLKFAFIAFVVIVAAVAVGPLYTQSTGLRPTNATLAIFYLYTTHIRATMYVRCARRVLYTYMYTDSMKSSSSEALAWIASQQLRM